jgi:sulfatase maturation enzyme AslB (radical SAM superfamily)
VVALTTFILKVASRCNLDCDYCYVYHHVDQSWRDQPHFMPPAIVSAAARRIAAHVSTHGVEHILVVLHGGEPTLAGPDRIDQYCTLIAHTVPAAVDFAMQTNGTLLSPAWLPILRRHRIRVGVSIDGPQSVNDAHRYDPHGRSSFETAVRGINLLRQHAPDLFGGLLCVVDVTADPVAVYTYLASFDPR